MTLFDSTMLMLGVSCLMMLIGFATRESRWGLGLMVLGTAGALLLIAYTILAMLE
ncbi:MAG: hypothetical protein IT498_01905 [Rubrivivax sp.]|uniref:hypothetical protein n=1 Tax=Ottowia sp. TaxID=1898956 RepID=UPI00217B1BFA|nr:hypothetical protein [Ottowia sp.]MCC6812778.1 hypothetical protein [Rubrivivax sp.]MCZ2090572.1 hypothetical protein [Burkholderiales bacterium]HNI84870.1 hypothetical protein [Ottowia sp.]HNJ45030.1 hypothetical protein [Ottowia sp.]HNK54367.1 hypothetical protein [Ottowia sp.]